MREQTLLEENSAYENAISTCETKIEEKRNEADSLLRKLKVSYQIIVLFLSVILFRYVCWSCYHLGSA